MKKLILFLAVIFLSRSNAQDLKKFFDEYDVKGSFILYDLNKDTYLFYDSARCFVQFIPASTFKIPNSIIGLETGVIEDENFVIPWDSVKRRESCDKDLTLKEAIQFSCVPYYQELARRVGEEKMQEMVKKLNYGNMNISGGLDMFWLTGDLRISQSEQIDFLKRLYKEELPVSKRSMDIVKSIIILDDSRGYIFRGKTGWSQTDSMNTGWLVGWIEKGKNVYFYATNVESKTETDKFGASRRKITENIMKMLGIM